MVLLPLLLTRTGRRAIRAIADNPPVAEMVGIDTRRVFPLVFALGSAVAALAATLMDRGATPRWGSSWAWPRRRHRGRDREHPRRDGGRLRHRGRREPRGMAPADGVEGAIAFAILLS